MTKEFKIYKKGEMVWICYYFHSGFMPQKGITKKYKIIEVTPYSYILENNKIFNHNTSICNFGDPVYEF